jgi:hypothetical protein
MATNFGLRKKIMPGGFYEKAKNECKDGGGGNLRVRTGGAGVRE